MQGNKKQWIPRQMFYRFLAPSFFSALALSVANVTDALVVGTRLGETGLAAIGIVTPVYMIYNTLGYTFSQGGCVTHGKLTAAGKNETALCHFRRLAGLLLLLSAAVALGGNLLLDPLLALVGVGEAMPGLRDLCLAYARPLLAACPVFMLNFLLYDFVRSDNDQSLAALGFSLGCWVDVALNILLVIVLHKGVAGAAMATVVAQAVSVAVLSVHFFFRRGVLCFQDLFRARADRKEIRRLSARSVWTGFSASARYIAQFVFLSLANRLLLRAGERGLVNGALYVAVFDLVMNVSYIALALYQACAEVMQPLISAFTEEHDRDSRRQVLGLALGWGLGTGLVLAGLLAVFAGPVSSLFGLAEAGARAVSVPAIRIYLLSTFLAGPLIVLTAYYQSSGQVALSGVMTMLRFAVTLLPVTLVFGLFLPADFWWLFPVSEALTVMAAPLIRKSFGKREEERPVFSASMDNEDHEIGRVMEELEAFCERQEVPPKKAVQIQLAVEELCLVIMQQAFTGAKHEYIQITLTQERNGDYILYLRNSAARFNPFDMQTARVRENARKEILDSVGVLMVKKQSKGLFYRNYQGFNMMMVMM